MKFKPVALLSLFCVSLLAGVTLAYFSFFPDSPDEVADEISASVERELGVLEKEVAIVLASIDYPSAVADKVTYPFFIYSADSLVYWSNHDFIPAPLGVLDTFDVKLIKTGTEAFLAKKTPLEGRRYLVSLILLQRNYIINNDYLNPEWNKKIFASGQFAIYEPVAPVGTSICLSGNCLFRVSIFPGYPQGKRGAAIAFGLISLSLVVLLVLAYDRLRLVSAHMPEAGLLLLYFFFLLVRWTMTQLDFPGSFLRASLFDPTIFASSNLNASLGDLLLNILAVFALCYYVFKHYTRFRILGYARRPGWIWVTDVFSALCILFAGLFPFVVIQTLYNNSPLILDISQSLQFSGLRIVAMLIVLLAGVSAFLFSHAFLRILAADTNRFRMWAAYLIGAFIFITVNMLTGQDYASSLILTTLYFTFVVLLRLFKGLKRLTYNTFAYLFVGIFFLSLNGAFAIQHFSEKEKIDNQFRFANNFLIDRDIFGEYLLSLAAERIANDAFTQTRLSSPFLGKEAIAQKIRQFFLPSYFNKYDVEIFIFNAVGQSIGNNPGPTFSELVSQYTSEPFRTSYKGIYFVNNPESNVTQKYLIVVPIDRLGANSGHVVIELSLKKIIPENVYPELLVDSRFQQFYRTQDLSYGVYTNGILVFTSGEFNYEKLFSRSLLGNTRLYTSGVSMFGYDHIAQEDHNGRVAVVSTKATPFLYALANFSFLFVLGLLIILLMIFIQGIFNYFKGRRLFFSARIQLYLNLAFFVPLIIVSISTLGLTSISSQQQLDSEYLNKSRIFGQEITTSIAETPEENTVNADALTAKLTALADLSNLDANIYSREGILLATSQPLIFESHLLSPYINRNAFDRISSGDNAFIESEHVGTLNYFVAYSPLKSARTGDLIGILGIPFFQSAYFLEKAQIVILTNILNIFAFIFIVLLILSYFVSEWLTFPLKFITYSLRRTSLTGMNNPLTWKSNDEIGLMVKEYNTMLYKLGESKNELEHTQREQAWREIAQQVAHEIKNPLTPMKLTLQQLERTLESGNGSLEKTQKAINILLAQVDTLNEIASSFSGFAKMPEPVIRRLELVSSVKRTVDLHGHSGDITFRSQVKDAFVMADEQMLSRMFSNIILNGLQSGNPGQRVQIKVEVSLKGDRVRIEFQDNGKGIDPAIADRVFLPHFSTKKSGSGLGLAIARQGIEQMMGKIWFETAQGKGTSFFIELPLAG